MNVSLLPVLLPVRSTHKSSKLSPPSTPPKHDYSRQPLTPPSTPSPICELPQPIERDGLGDRIDVQIGEGPTFPCFRNLPQELQDGIWTFAIIENEATAVTIELRKRTTHTGQTTNITIRIPRLPAVFHATRSSRAHAIHKGKLWDCVHNVVDEGRGDGWLYYHAPSQVLEVRIADDVYKSTTSGLEFPAVDSMIRDLLHNGNLAAKVQFLHLCHRDVLYWRMFIALAQDLSPFPSLREVSVSSLPFASIQGKWEKPECYRPNIAHLRNAFSNVSLDNLHQCYEGWLIDLTASIYTGKDNIAGFTSS
jgi:hypothetical protein